ncbi:hypothetical protein [Amycolatopsis sp. WAC 04197]|uniref:hypothetical protein n=1 Tax=Amycolatopsis sp. WAC 04197 TaxID=2203199 RepID=UPI000F7B003F|nr:hypothetical protein [Amycolatopsis sp. WAC 04197]
MNRSLRLRAVTSEGSLSTSNKASDADHQLPCLPFPYRWAVIVADLPPLTDDQITSLAVILNRIDKRRRATQDTEQKRAA